MGFSLSVELIDDYHRKARKTYELQSADYATAVTDTAAVIAALNAVTDLGVLSYTISEKTAVGDSPTAGANRDVGMTLSVMLQDVTKGVLKVPAPVLTGLDANGNLDITTGVWVTYVNLFGDASECYTSDGDHVIEFLAGSLDA